jgi:hypothetical protein
MEMSGDEEEFGEEEIRDESLGEGRGRRVAGWKKTGVLGAVVILQDPWERDGVLVGNLVSSKTTLRERYIL